MAVYRYVNVQLPEAKRLADLYGIAYDLQACRDYCDKYLRAFEGAFSRATDEAKHLECFSVYVFVKYGRCFKGGVRGKAGVEALTALSAEDLELHNLVVNIRDKYVAHSVNDLESHKVQVWLNPEEKGRKINSVGIESDYLAGPEPRMFESLKQIIDKLLSWIEAEKKREEERLIPIVAKNYDLNGLYSREAESPDRIDYTRILRPRRTP